MENKLTPKKQEALRTAEKIREDYKGLIISGYMKTVAAEKLALDNGISRSTVYSILKVKQ